jgi:HlyD family secretion protein
VPTVSATGALSGVTGGRRPGSVAVAPFAESDAAAVRAGDPARVTVEALNGLALPATVIAVAPTAVQISGVSSYYVTVALTEGDPRLRAGQTVEVTVPAPPR